MEESKRVMFVHFPASSPNQPSQTMEGRQCGQSDMSARLHNLQAHMELPELQAPVALFLSVSCGICKFRLP